MKFTIFFALLMSLTASHLARGTRTKLESADPQPGHRGHARGCADGGKAQLRAAERKGRKIFGGLVPYDEIWRTGANASTKLTFTEDVKIEGNPLKAGTYALYSIPGEKEWTMIIHTNLRHRSLAGDVYKQEEDVFRFKATPRTTADFVETFTMTFGDITTNSTKLALAWENTEVKFLIEFDVDSRINEQIAELTKAPEGMSAGNYFLAAEYNYHNDKDFAQADKWILEALNKSPKNPRFGLLRARILDKAGNRDEALRVIAEANAWAKEANNANYVEQTQLFWDSIKQ
jgi:tetratricopeptide (TPR) repeat protein